MTRFFAAALAASLLYSTSAIADVTVWISESGAVENLEKEVLETATTGSFGIWIDVDQVDLVSGVSVDVTEFGNAIALRGVTLNNPADNRWPITATPLIPNDGSLIGNISGGSLPSLDVGTGIGGAVPEDGPNGYLFATVDYEVVGSAGAVSDLQLRVGDLVFGGVDGNLILGIGSDPSDSTSPRATDSAFDGRITVGVPEPTSIALIGLALAGLVGLRRR